MATILEARDSYVEALGKQARLLKRTRNSPTRVNLLDGILGAARGITRNLTNAKKAMEHGAVYKGDPTAMTKVLEPWAQGKRTMTKQDMVLREVGAFAQVVAGVEKWYAANK